MKEKMRHQGRDFHALHSEAVKLENKPVVEGAIM